MWRPRARSPGGPLNSECLRYASPSARVGCRRRLTYQADVPGLGYCKGVGGIVCAFVCVCVCVRV